MSGPLTGPLPAGEAPAGGMRAHLRDPLHRTGYLLVLGAAASSLLGFVFWAIAARTYPPSVVGLNSAVISAMLFVSGVCQLGLNAVLVRYLPRAGPAARRLVARSYAITVALSLLAGAVAAATSALWSPRLDFLASDPAWFAGFVAGTTLWTLFTLQDSVLVGVDATGWVPVENVLYQLVKIALLAALAGAAPFAGPFVAWNVPLVVAVALVSGYVFARLLDRHAALDPDGGVDRRQILSVARGNYGGTLLSLGSTMLLPVVVANVEGPAQTAYFYIPWTILIGMQLVALNMTTSLTVEAARDETRLRELTRRALRLTLALVVPMAALTALVASPLLRVFGAGYAEQGAALLRMLAVAAIPNVVVMLGLAVARVEHRGGAVLAIQAAQFVLVMGLSVALLPGAGIDGVGIALLVSQCVVAAGLLAGLLRPLLFGSRPA